MKKIYIERFFFVFFCLSTLYACSEKTNYPEGKQLYELHCASCHGKQGEGLESLIPPLAAADMLQNNAVEVACWIRKGLEGKILVNGKEFENAMPPNERLSNTEITNIINYVQNAWGNKHKFITLEEVNQVLKNCK
jgi:mono/diheme cytochrome c family protein